MKFLNIKLHLLLTILIAKEWQRRFKKVAFNARHVYMRSQSMLTSTNIIWMEINRLSKLGRKDFTKNLFHLTWHRSPTRDSNHLIWSKFLCSHLKNKSLSWQKSKSLISQSMKLLKLQRKYLESQKMRRPIPQHRFKMRFKRYFQVPKNHFLLELDATAKSQNVSNFTAIALQLVFPAMNFAIALVAIIILVVKQGTRHFSKLWKGILTLLNRR